MAEEGVDLAVVEATDPSDVTEIVGSGAIPLGLKAQIHVLAARGLRGIDLRSVGTLLDEPPTGLIHPASANITNFQDIRGKRVGYIGHFGKVMIDDLARQAGMGPEEYATVRVGMNVSHAIARGEVDTGIGFTNFQRVELEELMGEPCEILRIDELNNLGCCCFCSVQYVAHGPWLDTEEGTQAAGALLRAARRGVDFTIEYPEEAWAIMTRVNPRLDTPMYDRIFHRTLPYFSRDLRNVERDWEKVGQFCKHLKVLDSDFDQHSVWTNELVPHTNPAPSAEAVTPGGILS